MSRAVTVAAMMEINSKGSRESIGDGAASASPAESTFNSAPTQEDEETGMETSKKRKHAVTCNIFADLMGELDGGSDEAEPGAQQSGCGRGSAKGCWRTS